MVDEFVLTRRRRESRRLLLLAQGRLVNLAVAEGHPPQVMDLSFAVQALACEWLVRRHAELEPVLHEVPDEIDAAVAAMKLATMGVAVDQLSPAQEAYLASWTGCEPLLRAIGSGLDFRADGPAHGSVVASRCQSQAKRPT